MIDPVELALPFPPSVNDYYGKTCVKSKRTGKQRVVVFIAKAGRKFRCDVQMICEANQVIGFGLTRIQMLVVLHPPTAREVDIDNFFKGLFDSLEHAAVFFNDRQIKCLGTIMAHPVHGGRVNITIKELQ